MQCKVQIYLKIGELQVVKVVKVIVLILGII